MKFSSLSLRFAYQVSHTLSLYLPQWQAAQAILASNKPLPSCTNNYVDVREFILQDLKTFGQTSGRDADNSPAIIAKNITMGQIEYMTAQVDLCRDMLKFSLFTVDRNSIRADFSNAKRLFEDLFSIILVVDPETVKMKSTEGLHLMKLRAMVLEVVIILCDLRANFRISLTVDAYERIFEEMERERTGMRKSLYRRSESQVFLRPLFLPLAHALPRKGYGMEFTKMISLILLNNLSPHSPTLPHPLPPLPPPTLSLSSPLTSPSNPSSLRLLPPPSPLLFLLFLFFLPPLPSPSRQAGILRQRDEL